MPVELSQPQFSKFASMMFDLLFTCDLLLNKKFSVFLASSKLFAELCVAVSVSGISTKELAKRFLLLTLCYVHNFLAKCCSQISLAFPNSIFCNVLCYVRAGGSDGTYVFLQVRVWFQSAQM